MLRRLRAPLALAFALLLLVTPAAYADAFDEILRDYQADGKIDPCKHSEDTLRDAQGQIPNDIEQYAPDLPASLKAALAARARGACDKDGDQSGGTGTTATPGSSGGTGTTPAPGTTTPAPTGTNPTAPGTPPAPPPTAQPAGGRMAESIPVSVAESDADAPVPVLLLAILGGLLLAAGLFVLLARFMGWGFEPLQPAWHNVREASWRGENAWYEFWDWVRLGR